MYEAQPVSDVGPEWADQSMYERVKNGLKTDAVLEGLTEDEILESRLAESGLMAHLASSPNIIRQRRTARFLNKLMSRH